MAVDFHMHIWPRNIGGQVNERGNVEIIAIDKDHGAVVVVEVHHAEWPHFLQQMGRMKGIGIVRPKSEVVVVQNNDAA